MLWLTGIKGYFSPHRSTLRESSNVPSSIETRTQDQKGKAKIEESRKAMHQYLLILLKTNRWIVYQD